MAIFCIEGNIHHAHKIGCLWKIVFAHRDDCKLQFGRSVRRSECTKTLFYLRPSPLLICILLFWYLGKQKSNIFYLFSLVHFGYTHFLLSKALARLIRKLCFYKVSIIFEPRPSSQGHSTRVFCLGKSTLPKAVWHKIPLLC